MHVLQCVCIVQLFNGSVAPVCNITSTVCVWCVCVVAEVWLTEVSPLCVVMLRPDPALAIYTSRTLYILHMLAFCHHFMAAIKNKKKLKVDLVGSK